MAGPSGSRAVTASTIRAVFLIAAAVAALPGRTLVVDGEVAIFDRQLRSRFDWLRDPDPEQEATPPLLMVFDLLYRAGRSDLMPPAPP
jgi:ATP-dependent DNA ligase